jgi:2-polyprenyl-3-methyl-5-hydroxy-6-metoxy-1,4-benzoquinol methylase
MKDLEFKKYKSEIRSTIRKVLSQSEPGRLDEAAFPAYSHPNPLINWLFWQRLRKTMEYLEPHIPYQRVLDFGCGSGVLLPFLAKISSHVTAADVDMTPFERMKAQMGFHANIETLDLKTATLRGLPTASYDVITALDVLEHVEDIEGTLNDLLRLLKQGGRLIVSGPTENIFYKLGRHMAGKEYSGDYHKRGIAEIKRELANRGAIDQIAVLYPPVPLFDLFAAVR